MKLESHPLEIIAPPSPTYPSIYSPFPSVPATVQANSQAIPIQQRNQTNMSEHSKTEERLWSEEDRRGEQPSTSEPKGQQDSLELTASEPEEQQESTEPSSSNATKQEPPAEDGDRLERLKRHREEIAHSIHIPDMWGKESLLRDWTGSLSAIEASLVPEGLSSARQALVVACRRAG